MKRFCFLFGFFLFSWGLISSGEAVVDRVVAVVNQEIITLSEVEKWIDPTAEEMVAEDRIEKRERNEVICRQVLERLIEEKLIDQEVKRSGVKISSKEIDAALEEIKRRNAVTEEDFQKALAIEGQTLETYRKQIERGLQRQKVISWSVKVETKPEEKDLKEFYQKNLVRYRTHETYRASHILFVIPKDALPDEIREIRKKAQNVLEKIKVGADFGEMALLYSQDASAKNRGDLGYFKKGELFPSFEKEALRLKVGEVSGLLRTEFGIHIIKLLDRREMEPLPFEEVKDNVKVDYYEAEIQKAFRQFLSTLKERAVIEIKL